MNHDEDFPKGLEDVDHQGPALVYCSDLLALDKLELGLLKMDVLLGQKDFSSVDEATQYLTQFIGAASFPFKPSTPFDEALAITLTAYDRKTIKARENAARKAIELCPDCAQPWVLLAESTQDTDEVERFFREGIAAGERYLGANYLKKSRQDAWSTRNRGYMRALAGLFLIYRGRDEKKSASRLGLDMLTCNPTDNQGMRLHLASLLLETQEYPQLNKILQRYRFDSHPHLRYAELLYLFRTLGDHHKTHRSLDKALASNGFVPYFLLGEWAFEDYFTFVVEAGSEQEAADYFNIGETSWNQTPEAIAWLRDALEPD